MSERQDSSQELHSSQEQSAQLRRMLLEKLSRALIFLGPLVILFGAFHASYFNRWALVVTYVTIGVVAWIILWSHKRFSLRVRGITIVLLPLLLSIIELLMYGWEGDARVFLLAFPILGVLFFGRRIGFFLMGVSLFLVLGIGSLIVSGVYTPLLRPDPVLPGLPGLLTNTAIFVMVAALLIYAQDALFQIAALELSRTLSFSARLQEQQAELDQRTQALQDLNYGMQRRAMHLEAASEIARVLASIFDLDQLLQRAVTLIASHYDFYHAGIFLVDEEGEQATLVASSSEGGRQMLAQGHSLPRGEGMVGWVLKHQQPRIALDVGEDAVHFANPLLAATRSEAALPLISGERLIGVLDVQSVREAAFEEDDVRSLRTLGDQLALAIDNARRLSSDAAFVEATSAAYRMARDIATASTGQDILALMLEMAHDQLAEQAFILMLDRERATASLAGSLRGAAIDVPEVELPITAEMTGMQAILSVALEAEHPIFVRDVAHPEPALPSALRQRLMVLGTETSARSVAVVPLRMRGPDVGVLVVYYPVLHVFSASERRFYNVLSDIAGISLERALLRQRTESQISQELVVGDISRKLRATLDPDAIMQTAVQELGRTLRAELASVEITGPARDTSDLFTTRLPKGSGGQ